MNHDYYAHLIVGVDGPVIPVGEDSVVIGRNPSNTLFVESDRSISRHHAVILRAEGRYLIEDLGSTNGTFVNGSRVSGRHFLSDGDFIEIGLLKLVFVLTEPLRATA
jgi:pSer/pThr/pTyr-binding forkhead associated (FHA) protein